MAAANNTFEETVALITAGQEIAQDSSRVGNALRTISMRIRGLNEETGEADETLGNIKNDISEFTNGKVSIMSDPNTYKGTFEVLQDIAKIQDELTDKQMANLSEKLFGKTRANIGLAILQNFDQAEKALQTMTNSAGNADAEMEIITNSLSYKLNALKETGTGIFQNLFQREDFGEVVDGLTTILELFDALTEKLGLFGTLAVTGGAAFGIKQIFDSFKSLRSATQATSVINVLSTAFPRISSAISNVALNFSAWSGGAATFFEAVSTSAGELLTTFGALIPIVGALTLAFAGFKVLDYVNSEFTRAQETATKAVDDYNQALSEMDHLSLNKKTICLRFKR